ncbi:MAG: hypothetical protein SNJ82_03945 [Gemmataceae bacterium]
MRHPFDGINVPVTTSRRSWLGWLGVLAGGIGLSSVTRAAAPPASRLGLRRDPNPEPEPEPKPSTLALKETGGKPSTAAAAEEGAASTQAVGEEGGITRARGEAGGPTTRALNEEGAMTNALNEAGGPIRVTTLAVGEEGGQKGEAPKE